MKVIEVVVPEGHLDTVAGVAQQHELDYWGGGEIDGGLRSLRMSVPPDKRQTVLDTLQHTLATVVGAHILIIPLEAELPRAPEVANSGRGKEQRSTSTTREEIYYSVEKGARLDADYLLLVFLSTIVVAIGLIENNVAVVIGAMVIAPLLGPNIALALATSLGDTRLAWKALKASMAGLSLALAVSVLIGVLWPFDQLSPEITARTAIGVDGVALALASGAAAVLSLTTGLPSVLVGVMVAVALMPPTATMGMMLGQGRFELASGAALLLLANVVCVNLAAKLVFVVKGVKPRTWFQREKARQSVYAYVTFWAISLGLILVVIALRGGPY